VNRTTYATLFAVISTSFGAGDGSTTFNLPNLKGRVPVGLDAAQAEFDAMGEAGGAKASTSSGTVAAPTFTGTSAIATSAVSAGTPAGTNSAPTFTGSALATHAHELPFTKLAGGTGALRMLAQSVFGSGTSRAPESVSAAPTANTTAATVALSQAVSAGTPAGTVTAPTFTGSALGTHQHTLTPTGTNSAPAFTGAAQSILQPYLVVNYVIKT
jgi:microcystin-dependent protein